ncbi:hypothetical protein EVG20_g9425 [Dentipellis fragilis]|uniref:Uncharacterized protein n=1 Tax=Dentipellis fragilis TaxID=205917 RepID=A0A4Y9Y2V4_9AGAM|nr:hypothetical protein EVG20_g9425 [Dentipellis fragilis]
MGSIFSAIGNGIIAILDAIFIVLETIVAVITTVRPCFLILPSRSPDDGFPPSRSLSRLWTSSSISFAAAAAVAARAQALARVSAAEDGADVARGTTLSIPVFALILRSSTTSAPPPTTTTYLYEQPFTSYDGMSHVSVRCNQPANRTAASQGSIFSAIGNGIIAIFGAIFSVIETIVGVITSIIVTIVDVIVDIICCRCFGSRRRSHASSGRSRGFGRRRGMGSTI